ncbi:MAG: YwbE family protein [Firmicutes bacterium]|nr:YwbE family protein [Bacillota bacterium]
MANNGTIRSHIHPGMEVDIVLKKDQRTGTLTRGVVKDILTNSATHPHGIKVRLVDGQVGRVQTVIERD